MLTTEQLKAKALDQCVKHARERLLGELSATAGNNLLEWDDFQMRSVFTQAMTLWRKYGRFDIIQNAAGTLIGFVDHDKYNEPGQSAPTRDDALALIQKAGVVPESARPVDYHAQESPLGGGVIGSFRFALARPEKEYDVLDVEVNGARQAVISVKPKRSEAFRG
jgi:hypothetical protein